MIDHDLAASMKTQYQTNLPFPHIVIDDFVRDERLLADIVEEINAFDEWGMDPVAIDHQPLKFFAPWNAESLQKIPKKCRQVLEFFNSEFFLGWLTKLTGIQNLLADDTFAGGGMHRIDRGGKLTVHSDFALHPDFRHLYRRINLLLYLNSDWDPSWGGSLQLYDGASKKITHDIQPLFNRAVIFNTTKEALHGHPHPLSCPQGRSRLSLALYYFTVEAPVDAGTNIAAIWHDECNQNPHERPVVSEF